MGAPSCDYMRVEPVRMGEEICLQPTPQEPILRLPSDDRLLRGVVDPTESYPKKMLPRREMTHKRIKY